jgi:NAD(P)-dependent dehydrogenase (short-subunit alcohol dehydrogenase family)
LIFQPFIFRPVAPRTPAWRRARQSLWQTTAQPGRRPRPRDNAVGDASCEQAVIVNLSSIFGIVAPPGQSAYAAAKFAVRGFSESLRHELQMANSPVRLSVVHPGGVVTDIVRNSRTGAGVTDNARRAQTIERFDEVARTTPAAAALRIIKGIENNQPRILIGNDARLMDVLQRFRPGTYWKVLAKRIERLAAKAGK